MRPSPSAAYMAACNVEFQKLGLRGASVLVASGDGGVWGRAGDLEVVRSTQTFLPRARTSLRWAALCSRPLDRLAMRPWANPAAGSATLCPPCAPAARRIRILGVASRVAAGCALVECQVEPIPM